MCVDAVKCDKTGESSESKHLVLKETALSAEPKVKESMVRTQIYLRKSEHEYCQAEAKRRDEPMAAVIRSFIDEKMEIPQEAWTNNPMLRPTPDDPTFEGHEDDSINHDHYIYGGPKKWIKVDGEWVEAPPVKEGDEAEDTGTIVHCLPFEPKSAK